MDRIEFREGSDRVSGSTSNDEGKVLENETKADAELDLRDLICQPARMWQRRRVAKCYYAIWNLRTRRTRWNWQITAWSEPARIRRASISDTVGFLN
jgi:hypothetical protein